MSETGEEKTLEREPTQGFNLKLQCSIVPRSGLRGFGRENKQDLGNILQVLLITVLLNNRKTAVDLLGKQMRVVTARRN